jgi:hypothetical protein
MYATVIFAYISRAQVLTKDVLRYPINFEIAKGSSIPTSNYGEGMPRFEVCFKEGFLRTDGTGAVPEFGYTRDIHPFVEELQVGHNSGFDLGGSWRSVAAAGP